MEKLTTGGDILRFATPIVRLKRVPADRPHHI